MGVTVKARNTIKRNGVYIAPGTVFEMPDQASADYLIGRGVVSPYLDKPIQAVAEVEITPEGKAIETPAFVPGSDAPPASFTDEPPAAKDQNRSKRR